MEAELLDLLLLAWMLEEEKKKSRMALRVSSRKAYRVKTGSG